MRGLPSLRTAVALGLGLSIFAYVVLALIGTQIIVYDTHHFGDTSFILGAGWRVYSGLEPAIDFGHFYGGFISSWLALAMWLFEPSVHAYHQTTLMMFVAASAAALAICWRRVSGNMILAIILLIATLLFTLHPLEVDQSVTRIWSAHSFLYNRVGFVLMILCALFLTFPSGSILREICLGALVGAIVVAAAYTKSPFTILGPAVLLGLLIQARLAAAAGVAVATVALVLVIDPGAQRFLAAHAYIDANVGARDDAQVFALLRKAVQIILAQPIALVAVLGAVITALRYEWAGLRAVLGMLIVVGAGIGMAATMGGGGNLGQLALPAACIALICLAELSKNRADITAPFLDLMALVVLAAFAMPHLANLAGAHLEGYANRSSATITQGPYRDYLSVPEGGTENGQLSQYQMLSEGLAELTTLELDSRLGIIADNGVSFEFARMARPVPGYPLWPRPNAPELAADRRIPPEADIVMMGRGAQTDTYVGPALRGKLTDDFVLCASSGSWDIFVRANQIVPGCRIN